jgi:hypothetical protein
VFALTLLLRKVRMTSYATSRALSNRDSSGWSDGVAAELASVAVEHYHPLTGDDTQFCVDLPLV